MHKRSQEPSGALRHGGRRGFLLSSAYIFRLEWARTLNFSLIYGILVIVALELCLDLGIIPSTRSFDKVFAKLPFDLKIVSRDGSLFRKTEAAAGLDAAVARALAGRPLPDVFTLPAYPDDVFFAWPLSGGSALLTREMSNMRSLGRQLMARRADLEQDRCTLEHDRDRIRLIANELASDLRAVGIDCAAIASLTRPLAA